ncbi:hypothetical protein [Salmonella enterica]|uniref:hypothetical protein n=1 Tax=Salmonella enterica TaxID=28901 RepID=UPI003A7FA3AE
MIPFARILDYGNIVSSKRTIKKVQFGSTHFVILDSKGVLWGCGTNNYNQLGFTNTNVSYYGRSVEIMTNVFDVWVYGNYTLIKKIDGTFWYTGLGGINDTASSWVRMLFEFGSIDPSTIVDVFCHQQMLHFKDINGNIYAIGSNSNVNSGISGSGSLSVLTAVQGITDVNYIQYSTAAGSAVAICNNGDMYVWGRNANGEFGLGHTNAVVTPLLFTRNVGMVGTGYSSSMYLNTNKAFLTAGNQIYGQLGNGNVSTTHINQLYYQIITYTGDTSNIRPAHRGNGTFNMAFVSDTGVYSTGYKTGIFGTGYGGVSGIGTFTKCTLNIDFSKVIGLSASHLTSCLYTDEDMYQSGDGRWILGDGSTNETIEYKKVKLPWEEI